MSDERIAAILRRDVPVLTPETPIRRAAALLVDARLPAAPVAGEDGRLVGILTQKDCFKSALHASYYREWKGRVAEHMTREVVSLDAQDGLIHAAELFLTQPHRVFPVLDSGRIAGLLLRSDVLARLVHLG